MKYKLLISLICVLCAFNATAQNTGKVIVNDEPVRTMLKRGVPIKSYAVSSDEKYIFTRNNNHISIWDYEKMHLIRTLDLKSQHIYAHPTDSRLFYFSDLDSESELMDRFCYIVDWQKGGIIGAKYWHHIDTTFEHGNTLYSHDNTGGLLPFAYGQASEKSLGFIGGAMPNTGSARPNHNDSLIVTSGNYPIVYDLYHARISSVIPYYNFLLQDTTLHFESARCMPIPKTWTTSIKNKLFFYYDHNFTNSYWTPDGNVILGGINGIHTEWSTDGKLKGMLQTHVGPAFAMTWKGNDIAIATRNGLYGGKIASSLPKLEKLSNTATYNIINTLSPVYKNDRYLIGTSEDQKYYKGKDVTGKASLFEARIGKDEATWIPGNWSNGVHDIKISRDEKFAAVVYGHRNLSRLDLETKTTGNPLKWPHKEWDQMVCCEVLPGGAILGGTFQGELYYFPPDGNEATHRLINNHTSIQSITLNDRGNRFYVAGTNGDMSVWRTDSILRIVDIIPMMTDYNENGYIFITPDHYYKTTKDARLDINFAKGTETFDFEQFDLRFNRPDIVLQRLGGDPEEIKLYRQAYLKRLKRSGISEKAISPEYHVPTAEITNADKLTGVTKEASVMLDILLSDTKYPLQKAYITLNGVPLLGKDGLDISKERKKEKQLRHTIELASGMNEIKVSCLNAAGAESYKKTVRIICERQKKHPALYIASIGVSEYGSEKSRLNYARKDAHDFASMFNGSDKFSEIKRLIITDKDFSEKSLADIRQFFSSAGRDDVAMLFYAGHGLLDKDLEYYLATSNVDFSNPFNGGVHYDNFVGTLDGISPLKKYCFIDACHSGEISKDDYIAQNTEPSGFSKGYIVFRGVSGLKARKRDIENVNALLSEMFTDLRWGVGATVISSAAGSEFAIEGDEWGNGLFTYCLKETANNAKTDRNGDGNISAEEWLKAASIKVKELSEGHQSPNLRSDNYHSSLIISSTKKK